MKEQMDNISKEMQFLRGKKQLAKVKNVFDRFTSRLDTAKEKNQ